MNVLVLNAGSSSLKYQLINVETHEVLAKGICERVGSAEAFHKHGIDENEVVIDTPMPDHNAAMALVLEALTSGPTKAIDSLDDIDAVGHRVVQGGKYFDRSVLIDDDVVAKIDELAGKSMRVLAFGYSPSEMTENAINADTVLIGLVGIRDDVRPEAREAIAEVQKAGIQVVMITGDRLETAVAMAEEMCRETAPFGLRLTKEALQCSLDGTSFENCIKMENRNQVLASNTNDGIMGTLKMNPKNRADVKENPEKYAFHNM